MKRSSICSKEEKLPAHNLPHVQPIYATSAFNFSTLEEGIDIFKGDQSGYVYSRFDNPNITALENKIAKLEGYGLAQPIRAVLTNSGMSALSITLSALTQPGDLILTQPALYGGSISVMDQYFHTKQISVEYIDLLDLAQVEEKIKSAKQKVVLLIETPANPTLTCYDLAALSKIAQTHNAHTIVDNTFATFLIQQPLLYGIDFVIHSNTKYINGHGNGISGVIVANADKMEQYKIHNAMKLLGANCSPMEAWLCSQGLKTMNLRVERQSENALNVAEYLAGHNKVHQVNYPGLKSHPTHKIAIQQMNKGFGGMLSFDVGNITNGKKFMKALQFMTMAPTLGDVDTILLHPASMSHLNMNPDDRQKLGITDGLIRMSVGIEDLEDILSDLSQALDQL